MCGIAGIIAKDSDTLGNDLISMLKELIHRGKDSTGIAVYEQRDHACLRVSLRDSRYQNELEQIIEKYAKIVNKKVYQGKGVFTFLESAIDIAADDIAKLNWEIDTHPHLCVHSIGRKIKVYKDEGSAEELREKHSIDMKRATHGIGHVRLATESIEDINFAHPFVSYIFPELAIVHNGQFTNYFNLRRKLENLGVRFKTNNDSEMAAHFLAYHMKEKGMSLEEALWLGLDTFDGVFTLLVSTPEHVGAVRDRLGIKPLLYYEQDGSLALFGSEQICLTSIVYDVYATEMDPGDVKVWHV
ncbi:MAG: glutamine amidotransferase [Deltaproteobacteria bacterium]|nr:glutamine amidotransferase [Deltaproteobacteria bacterium]MBW2024538.1 glutamine amidotransferase [Deltaproteobacteria bacterium]MBW2124735.1 glutamine amidotransferase [Deltaproteobacteria bacterium]